MADSNLLDSLKNALNNTKHDTTRVGIYLELSEATYMTSPEKSTEYDKKALALAEKNFPLSKGAVLHTFKKTKADALNNIGYIHKLQGNTDKALEYYLQSLEIGKEINDKKRITYLFNFIGEVYLERKDYTAATDYCMHSLRLAEELGFLKTS